MSLGSEIQSLSPSALVELFALDLSAVGGGSPLYFHAGTNALQQPVIWQGVSYFPLPIEAEGFDISAKGVLPRPRVRIANAGGILSAEIMAHDDLIGCKLTRRRTFARFLDATNFPGGVNPDADANQHFPDDVWFVQQKLSETRYIVEWELASVFDLQGVMLPYRQVIQNTCTWLYRGPECGWTGGNFDKNDSSCGAADDSCAKRLTSCRVRFGAGQPLPYGGFPGARTYGN